MNSAPASMTSLPGSRYPLASGKMKHGAPLLSRVGYGLEPNTPVDSDSCPSYQEPSWLVSP